MPTVLFTAEVPVAQGQGFRGIPGDGTSPSRFIRVLTDVRFAPAPTDQQDAELQAIRVLHGFDIAMYQTAPKAKQKA